MIVCICRRLNENKIREAVEAGASCPNSVMAHHETRFNCGQCRQEMNDLIEDASKTRSESISVAAE